MNSRHSDTALYGFRGLAPIVGALLISMLLASTALGGVFVHRPKIDDELRIRMKDEAPDVMLPIVVVMAEQAEAQHLAQLGRGLSKEAKRERVVEELKRLAGTTQVNLLSYLEELEGSRSAEKIVSLWLLNAVSVRTRVDAIGALARFPEVGHIFLSEPRQGAFLERDPFFFSPSSAQGSSLEMPRWSDEPADTAWGVLWIGADEVWQELGLQGQGVLVAMVDTGVDYNHSDLENRMWHNPGEIPNNGIDDDNNGYIDDWYGYDFGMGDPDPMDDNGHGTHTSGTVAGDGTGGILTGVAPQATIMACKVGYWVNYADEATMMEGTQYAVDNGADVLSMSMRWHHAWEPHRFEWRQLMENGVAAGLPMVIAAGNEQYWYGAPHDVGTPSDCPDVITIGATGYYSDVITNFSSEGPTVWDLDPPYNDYPYPPGLLKPDVCAPGENVNSTTWGGGYSGDTWDGTSMATPHVTGTVALMLSGNPGLTPLDIKYILEETAIELGPAGKDSLYGSGRIVAPEAVLAALVGYGWVEGFVTDSTTSLGLPATVGVPGTSRQTTADTSGYYFLGLPGDSSYVLEASYFGYIPQQQNVYVAVNDTVGVDFMLLPAVTGTVEGHVYEAADGPIEGAEVRVLDTPLDPVYTDDTGYYTIDVPGGTSYDLSCSATGYEPQIVEGVFVPENQIVTVDFTLSQWPDILIWEPDPTPITGAALQDALAANGFESILSSDLLSYGELSYFQAIFVAVGIYSDNYVIQENSTEALALEEYVADGGNLYLEGGDVWYYDPMIGGHEFGPLFGINPTSDGSGDLYSVSGVANTLMPGLGGMTFSYTGGNNWIDHIAAIAPAELVFENSSNSDPIGVAMEQSAGGHTIGTSFEFGGLVDGAYTKEEVAAEFASFFQLAMPSAVTVDLVPGAAAVPQGGTFSIEVTFTNHTGEVQVFDAWADVVLPNSNPYGPVAGPKTVTLAPNQTRVVTRIQEVPAAAPLGTYTYCGKIGAYPDDVMDEDCFEIEVVPGM